MKTKLFILGLASFFFVACSSNDDGAPVNTLPKTETELKTNITKKWDIASNTTYKSIEFKADGTYKVAKHDGNAIEGDYTIAENLHTLILDDFGTVTLSILTSNKLNFSLKPEGLANEISFTCSPGTVKILISEIMKEDPNNIDLPLVQFEYDANGILNKAIEYEYFEGGIEDPYYKVVYTFERDKNSNITKAEKTYYHSVAGEEELNGKRTYTAVYENGNIVRISETNYTTDNNELEISEYVYRYTWLNGKITKVEQDDDDTVEFTYTNGNYLGYEDSSTDEYDNGSQYNMFKRVFEYDTNKNWYSYLPIEYLLVSDPNNLWKGIPLSNNNIAKGKRSEQWIIMDETDKKLSEEVHEVNDTYVYIYSNGLVENYTETGIGTNKYIDYTDPSNSYERTDNPIVENYKIKYIEF